jgi:adenylate cyclase
MKVLGAVRVKLEGLGGSAWMKYYKGTQGLDCFMKLQQSFSHIQRMTIPDNNQARQIAEEGLAMCPEGPGFYRLLANVNLNDIQLGSSKDPRESVEKAEELLQKALAIDDNNAEAHGNLSQVYTRKREYDRAVAEAERGVALDPGSSWALYRYGIVLNFVGRSEEAIPLFEKAIRLNPLGPAFFYYDYGTALRDTGRLEEAVASLKKAVERAPNWFWPHAALASAYSMLGRDEESHVEASEVLRINPRFSLEWVARISSIKDRSRLDKVINEMRKAGLPDKPPPQP